MKKRNRYTKEMLEPIIAQSKTWVEVCNKVGIQPYTGAQTNLRNRCKEFGLDTSHFLGQAHRRGKKFPSKIPIEKYLVRNSRIASGRLRVKLIEEGIKEPECEKCGLREWSNEPIPLELDHINSDHWDNRLDNLQILCPNCHAQETQKRVNEKKDTKKSKITTKTDRPTKIDWPATQALLDMVEELGYSETGRRLNVSDNAVRKRIKSRGSGESW